MDALPPTFSLAVCFFTDAVWCTFLLQLVGSAGNTEERGGGKRVTGRQLQNPNDHFYVLGGRTTHPLHTLFSE